MEQIECSETSAYNNQTPGKYTKEYIQDSKHGESLNSRKNLFSLLDRGLIELDSDCQLFKQNLTASSWVWKCLRLTSSITLQQILVLLPWINGWRWFKQLDVSTRAVITLGCPNSEVLTEILCITRIVEHNYISLSTVRLQLHVSAL